MNQVIDFSALIWVKNELEETLREARQALELHVDNPDDQAQLGFLSAHLHQVYGTLQMVELYGAALLAEEMEQVTKAIASKSVNKHEEACEVLMRAILQLPDYLDRLIAGYRDIPIVLLPTLNDLRAVRGATLLSDNAMFSPDLDAVLPEEIERKDGACDLRSSARELRHRFQIGLLGWLREQNTDQSLNAMSQVLQELLGMSARTEVSRLWWVAGGIVESLKDESLETTVAVKRLFGQVDREIKRVADFDESSVAQDPALDLIKNLLFYAAQSSGNGPNITTIKNVYNLAALLPAEDEIEAARESISGQNADLFATVSVAVKEELTRLKDALDIVLRSASKDAGEMVPLVDSLNSLGDTLGMLSLDAPRKAMLAKASDLRAYTEEGNIPPETLIMDVASTLLFVESSVDGLGAGRPITGNETSVNEQIAKTEYDQVMSVVLQEAIADLGRGKEAIVSYAASLEQSDQLDLVPQLFNQVKGGLLLLGESRAASLIGAIKKYISSELVGNKPQPPQNELNSLADSICGLEYYLEGRKDHRMFGGAAISIAEESVERLGYPTEATDSENEVGEAEQIEGIDADDCCVQSNEDTSRESQDSNAGEEARVDQEYGEDAIKSHCDEFNLDVDVASWKSREDMGESENDSDDVCEFAELDSPEYVEASETSVVDQVLEPESFAVEEKDDRNEIELEINQVGGDDLVANEQDGLAVIGEDTDEEILEIFIEEAEEVIESINQQLPMWVDNPDDTEALASLRRSYHTLKGSGRLVGAMRIGEFAWAFETMLNRLIEQVISVSPSMLDILNAAGAALPELVQQIKDGSRVKQPVNYLSACAEALSKGESLPPACDDEGQLNSVTDEMEVSSGGINGAEVGVDPIVPEVGELVGGQMLDEESSEIIREESKDYSEYSEDNVMDSMLYEIFNAESRGHLEVIRQYLNKVAAGDARVDELLARALHTLHGSAHMANAHAIADLSGELERFVKALLSADAPMSKAGCDILQQSAQAIENMLDYLPMELPTPESFDEILSEIQQLRDSVPVSEQESTVSAFEVDIAPDNVIDNVALEVSEQSALEQMDSDSSFEPDDDQELIDIFLEKSRESLDVCEAALGRWQKSRGDSTALGEYQREIRSLDGNSRMAGFPPIGKLSQALESLIEQCVGGPSDVSDEIMDGCAKVNVALINMLDQVRDRVELDSAEDLISELEELRSSHTSNYDETIPEQIDSDKDSTWREEKDATGEEYKADEEVLDQYSEVDSELLEIFLEEASDILENSETSLREWRNNPEDPSYISQLQRELHTLKGGARMADITVIGDLAHAVESLMVNVSDSEVRVSEPLFVALHQAHDALSDMIERVKNRRPLSQSASLLQHLKALQSGESVEVGNYEEDAANATPKSAGNKSTEKDKIIEDRRSSERSNQELVRVKAKLLDNMVNYAGEVSIYRSRLEQKVGAYRFNLVEMEQTISRLREQLRKMEIETEAQVLFRYETETVNSVEQFDPLEMDRYSHMQQLSRSLVESVSDLGSIQNLLENLTSESETLLLQQSRVNTELQEGLMRTRMVPFLGLAARMRRIVRQTCQAVGNKAELELSGAEGEMDRTVVDRVIAPIEHMLRNAVSHGIEAPQDRLAAGKAESGTISIVLERESSDVVLRIMDDGAGIDLKAIRKKAIERGLMAEDDGVSDDEALQFILETGFSTAAKVTQVAGRGVGMDVVNSEVKQLGGSLHIASEQGKGTTFTMRLPFTLALNQALLVEVGEDTYAIPLSSIEGIVRMPREDLARYNDDKDARFSYGGYDYKVSHLGTLLGSATFHIDSGPKSVPVLLARVGELCVAFQVDNLLGSREIVVKSVGPQISTVRGVSGATILGDGRVIMILDLIALLRGGATNSMAEVESIIHRPMSTKQLTVMVVDDSITVRKVTTRLLERNDMKVISAKDGVDAVAKLQDNIPDIMLLDIEMPRMDGFELATHVRNESRLSGIPIIMITSRTGDKHRQRAMQIGVNRYLGKPFQESELLENIRGLLEEQQ